MPPGDFKRFWTDLRFRQTDETSQDLDSNAPIEVTLLDGLPVQIVKATVPLWVVSAALADKLVTVGTGILHSVIWTGQDAAATAGSVDIRDGIGTAAPSVLNVNFAAAYLVPGQVFLDIPYSAGLYIDFTTTADVNVYVLYQPTP